MGSASSSRLYTSIIDQVGLDIGTHQKSVVNPYELEYLRNWLMGVNFLDDDIARDLDVQLPPGIVRSATYTYVSFITTGSNRCNSCHGGAGPGADLRTYAALRTRAQNGNLILRLTSNDNNIRMPRGGTALSQADIDLIRNWVAAGAPNN
jgi:hypothetical protein